jgi:hypothetical protein
MNEEEIKIKYVIPWLQQAGAELTDVQLERSFTIRLGRSVISAESALGDTRRGRLDILVRRGESNLFVIETKAASEALTDADRDQAVSYARLVHPIAPYAMVTNGDEYRLYHTITKELIEPSELRIRGFEASLPEAALIEAQSYFLRLNRANLLVLCRGQVDSELRRIRGEPLEGKKYVPRLHVSRQSFMEAVNDFQTSGLPGLLLTAPSGSGKTCELCFLAETLLREGRAVFFFNGAVLAERLIDAISAEFNWAFNSAEGSIRLSTLRARRRRATSW